MDAVRLVLGIRWSACAVQHAGPADPKARRGGYLVGLAVSSINGTIWRNRCVRIRVSWCGDRLWCDPRREIGSVFTPLPRISAVGALLFRSGGPKALFSRSSDEKALFMDRPVMDRLFMDRLPPVDRLTEDHWRAPA